MSSFGKLPHTFSMYSNKLENRYNSSQANVLAEVTISTGWQMGQWTDDRQMPNTFLEAESA